MDYQAKLDKIDADIEALNSRRGDLTWAWAVNEHPLKKGDICEVTGYSYRGKKMVVGNAWVIRDRWDKKWYWFATGIILKKDGTPGVVMGEWKKLVTE